MASKAVRSVIAPSLILLSVLLCTHGMTEKVNRLQAVVQATAPPNNECSGALVVQDGLNGPYDTTAATTTPVESSCSIGIENDLWFIYNAASSGVLTVSTCGQANFTTDIEILNGSCAGLTPLVCNYYGCASQSTLSIPVTNGDQFYIRVGGVQEVGVFNLTISTRPSLLPNDECSGALVVQDGLNGPYNNQNASTSVPVATCGDMENDLWFVYDVTSTGTLVVSTCKLVGVHINPVVEVYRGSCGDLTPLECRSQNCKGPPVAAVVRTQVTTGERVYIRVGGYLGGGDEFKLDISIGPPLPNDDCSGAVVVTNGVNGPYDNTNASTSVPVFTCGGLMQNDLWFVYDVASTGTLVVTTCKLTGASMTFPGMEVYRGSCGNLTSKVCEFMNCDYNSKPGVVANTAVTTGERVYIRVGSSGQFYGAFSIDISISSPNECLFACIGTAFGSIGKCFSEGLDIFCLLLSPITIIVDLVGCFVGFLAKPCF